MHKLVAAYVATVKRIQGHTAARIADQLPPDDYAGWARLPTSRPCRARRASTTPQA
jgi:hypothetical protein